MGEQQSNGGKSTKFLSRSQLQSTDNSLQLTLQCILAPALFFLAIVNGKWVEAAGWGFPRREQSPAAARGFLSPQFLAHTDPGHLQGTGMVLPWGWSWPSDQEGISAGIWSERSGNEPFGVSLLPQSPRERGAWERGSVFFHILS